MSILYIFKEHQEMYRLNLLKQENNEFADRDLGLRFLMYSLNQFYHPLQRFQIESFIKTFFDKYGKTSQNLEFLEENLVLY